MHVYMYMYMYMYMYYAYYIMSTLKSIASYRTQKLKYEIQYHFCTIPFAVAGVNLAIQHWDDVSCLVTRGNNESISKLQPPLALVMVGTK